MGIGAGHRARGSDAVPCGSRRGAAGGGLRAQPSPTTSAVTEMQGAGAPLGAVTEMQLELARTMAWALCKVSETEHQVRPAVSGLSDHLPPTWAITSSSRPPRSCPIGCLGLVG